MGKKGRQAGEEIEQGSEEAAGATRKLGSSAEESSSRFTSLSERVASFKSRVASVASGVGVFNLVNSAVNGLKNTIGDAVSRVDTLNNASRVFQNMGFSANDTKAMMDNLNKSIMGLPTSLDSAVQGVQMMAATTNGDLGQAQKVWSSLNDAVIGFGGTADQAKEATIQLSQAFANGKVDAQTWNSLMNDGLGPALDALAKSMHTTTGQLKSDLSSGKVSVKQFQDAMIEMDQKGGGGMQSFSKIAHDATSGIKTSFTNMQTAIKRGMGEMIKSFSSALETITGSNLSQLITKFGATVSKILTKAASDLTGLAEKIKPFVDVIKNSFQQMAPPVKAALTAVIDAV